MLRSEGGALINGVSTLLKRDASPFHQVRTEREVWNLEEGPHRTRLAPRSQTSSLQMVRNASPLFTVCGILLQQPRGTKTVSPS